MSAPSNSAEVSQRLASLTERLYSHVRVYAEQEVEAAKARATAEVAESRAFLSAEGAMDLRKHIARVAAHEAKEAALVQEAVVKTLRMKIAALETDIEVHRTYGTTLRAELKTLGAMEG